MWCISCKTVANNNLIFALQFGIPASFLGRAKQSSCRIKILERSWTPEGWHSRGEQLPGFTLADAYFLKEKASKKKSCAETEQKCHEIYCLFSQSSRWRMFGITFSPLHMPLCGTCGPSLLLHFSRDPVSRTGSSDISSTVANCNIQAAVNFPESALFPMPAKCASPEALSRDTSSRHSLWCNKSWEHSWHTGRALDVPAILIVLDSSLSPNCTVGRPVHSLLSAYLCPQAT